MAENIQTIGATSRDFATINAWEAATDVDLTASPDEIEVGQCFADADFSENVVIAGATTDANNFRWLRAASGQEYDPITDTGVVVTAALVVFRIQEPYFRLSRVKVLMAGAGAGFQCIDFSGHVGNVNVLIFGCNVVNSSTNNGRCIFISGTIDSAKIVSCITETTEINSAAAIISTSRFHEITVSNCSVAGAFSIGIQNIKTVTNCSVSDSVTTPFSNIGTLTTSFSGVAADLWHDPSNNNFYPKAGGVLDGTGTDLSADPDLIATIDPDASHGDAGDWNAAPYDGLQISNPLLKTNTLGKVLLI